MLGKERLLYILKRVQADSFISVNQLCEEMNVSKSTIQRDLKTLEDDGKIVREHGGATKKGIDEIMSDLTEVPVMEKMKYNVEAKKIICAEASKNVKNGDLIFIDSGTTPVHLIPHISHKQIKIVTNSYFVLSKLSGCAAQIYMLGGLYAPKHEVCYGSVTLEYLKQFRFDHAFIGANGVDLNMEEVFASEFEIGALKKAVMERSKKSHLLVDDSKFSCVGLCTFSNTSNFTNIYVNRYSEGAKMLKNIILCKEV